MTSYDKAMTTREIVIDLDKKCKICGKGGATPSGYCMKCTLKKLERGDYDHVLKKERKKLGIDREG